MAKLSLMSQEEDREANLFIALIVVLMNCYAYLHAVSLRLVCALSMKVRSISMPLRMRWNYQQRLRHIHIVSPGELENCYFRFMEERKRRHQQDLNLRSHRETDIRGIRICRLNHSAIVS
jgi:hypothetical protein